MSSPSSPPLEQSKPIAPVWIFKLVNPFIKALLRSPLHRLLSGSLMLLTYQGRKSGQWYTNPIGYFAWDNDEVVAFTSGRWWTNLLDGRRVALRIQDQQKEAIATIIHDHAAVVEAMPEVIRRLGAPSGLRLAMGLQKDRQPTVDDFRAIPSGRTIVLFKIIGKA